MGSSLKVVKRIETGVPGHLITATTSRVSYVMYRVQGNNFCTVDQTPPIDAATNILGVYVIWHCHYGSHDSGFVPLHSHRKWLQ